MSIAVSAGMTRLILLLSLAFAACREASGKDERDRSDPAVVPSPPCAGCTLDLPTRRDSAIPLLVVFHGDGEGAEAAARRWRPARERGWAVLALRCPKSEGCDEGRWYRWNGPPRWVTAQVSEVQRQIEIDPARIYLAGWSGGATYLGMNADRWPRMFAAVVYHGGGQPPPATRGCPARDLPAYFLVGDQHWAHPAQVRLRDYYERCHLQHEWDLLDGASHAAEERALTDAKVRQILGWLERHAQPPLVGTRFPQ